MLIYMEGKLGGYVSGGRVFGVFGCLEWSRAI